jgi:hypothetical protein
VCVRTYPHVMHTYGRLLAHAMCTICVAVGPSVVHILRPTVSLLHRPIDQWSFGAFY